MLHPDLTGNRGYVMRFFISTKDSACRFWPSFKGVWKTPTSELAAADAEVEEAKLQAEALVVGEICCYFHVSHTSESCKDSSEAAGFL